MLALLLIICLLLSGDGMARGFFIAGESIVMLKGNGLLADPNNNNSNAGLWELGLASDPILVTPRLVHKKLKTDSYGDEIPPDVLWMLADCTISMTLVHFDPTVLRRFLAESMCQFLTTPQTALNEGVLAAAGKPLGAWIAPGKKGNRYVSVSILSQQAGLPWRFPTCYLPNSPLVWPLSTEKSLAGVTIQAIPYANPPAGPGGTSQPQRGEITSGFQTLWDHGIDTGAILNANGTSTSEAPLFVGDTTATVGTFNPFAVPIYFLGNPNPAITSSGLPTGATLTDRGNGCVVISGGVVSVGNYTINFTATNAVGSASLAFNLKVV